MAFDLIPETVKSQSARDEANKRTSNLPTLGGVAKGLSESILSCFSCSDYPK